jgi:hypothetical protein
VSDNHQFYGISSSSRLIGCCAILPGQAGLRAGLVRLGAYDRAGGQCLVKTAVIKVIGMRFALLIA